MIRGTKLQGYLERCNKTRRPITADIFLTDYCNEHCKYCRYAHKSGEYMKFNDFVMYVRQLLRMGVQSVILTGGGEPMLNPDFDKITGWLERNNIRYGVNSNLKMMHFCKPVFLKVSIDTGVSERYKAIRGIDGLADVLRNVRDFCDYRKRANTGTKVGVQCVALREDDVNTFYDAVKSLDVDYIYFRPYEGRESKVSRTDVEKWLGNRVLDERIVLSYKFDYKDYQPGWCVSNWSVICVDVNGNVPYCCHRPDEIIGSVLDLNVLKKKAAYHVDMRKCERPCRLSGSNYWLEMREKENDEVFV